MAKCRRCKINEGTLYYDGRYKKTKTPVCQQCLETLASVRSGMDGFSSGYTGPGRDPDHDNLSTEHIDAQDWWELQTRDSGE